MKLKEVFNYLLNLLNHPFSKTVYYRVEGMDNINQVITLNLVGRSICVKMHYFEVVNDIDIINKMSSKDACLLGVTVGRICKKNRFSQHNVKGRDFFSLALSGSQYKVISKERNGMLHLLDIATRKSIKKSPLQVINDMRMVSKLSPSVACYIGILAGKDYESGEYIMSHKQNNKCKVAKKPVLRLVK